MKTVLRNSVQSLRSSRGITQKELAGAIGVTRQTIIAVEQGHCVPSIVLALSIARFLKEPVEKLFTLKMG